GRLQTHEPRPGVELLRASRGAAERTARAEAGDEVRHRAARLLPDLCPGAVVVGAPVGVVVVLVGHEIAPRVGGYHGAHRADGAIASLHGIAEYGLRPIRVDQLASLVAHVSRHDQPDAIPLRRADHGVRDARIAAGAVGDDAVGREPPAAFGFLDHAQRRSVLDRAAGIHELGLRVDRDLWTLELEDADAQQRRRADAVEDALAADRVHDLEPRPGGTGGRAEAQPVAAPGEPRKPAVPLLASSVAAIAA